jgi:hypothetical protein
VILLIFAFFVARITGVSHQLPALCKLFWSAFMYFILWDPYQNNPHEPSRTVLIPFCTDKKVGTQRVHARTEPESKCKTSLSPLPFKKVY